MQGLAGAETAEVLDGFRGHPVEQLHLDPSGWLVVDRDLPWAPIRFLRGMVWPPNSAHTRQSRPDSGLGLSQL